MRIYLEPPVVKSRSLGRIADALRATLPTGVERTIDIRDADLVVLHVIGRRDQMTATARFCVEQKKAYVVNQYCLRSTRNRRTSEWAPLWADAKMVWSYYNLNAWMREDGLEGVLPNFYHSPLGVNITQFLHTKRLGARPTRVLSTGYTTGEECLQEIMSASSMANVEHAHLGDPMLEIGPHVHYVNNITDPELVALYNDTQYVSALRRREGFELPAAEGLLCGARPIMFDRPHYRQWFDEFATFVQETDPHTLTSRLMNVLQRTPVRVTEDERAFAAERFDWTRIGQEYWERCL